MPLLQRSKWPPGTLHVSFYFHPLFPIFLLVICPTPLFHTILLLLLLLPLLTHILSPLTSHSLLPSPFSSLVHHIITLPYLNQITNTLHHRHNGKSNKRPESGSSPP